MEHIVKRESRRGQMPHGAARAVMLALTMACASGGNSSRAAIGPRKEQNLIGRSELAETAATNAYDAINTLRPQWFRNVGRVTLTMPAGSGNSPGAQTRTPVVYFDQRPYGPDLTILRTVAINSILELRFLSPSEAQMKWGEGLLGGVIQVVTMTGTP
jgi:hypothetical protein